jgi:hypothetical protein
MSGNPNELSLWKARASEQAERAKEAEKQLHLAHETIKTLDEWLRVVITYAADVRATIEREKLDGRP